MTEPARIDAATVVARLVSDAATARKIADALSENPDQFAVSAFVEGARRWSLAIHFRDRPDEAAVRALVASAAGAAAARALTFETLAPTDWVRKSLEGLEPVEAGRFLVHAAHARARVRANRIGIEIDASLAFGTGTGVLAIAVAKSLHRPVLASDLDRRAVAIARGNARINRVGGAVEVIHAAGLRAAAFRVRAPYRLILANILLDPLRELATPIARLVAPKGHVVLSGLLVPQAAAALAIYRARGLVLVYRLTLENWATLILVRPAVRRAAKRGRAAG